MEFESVIGLEIHVQLKTKSKMFCRCPVAQDDSMANSCICPVCTGQPGALPILNPAAVKIALKVACALKCDIHPISVFARKNYFYPDLPKAYQISQYDKPLAENGKIELPGGKVIKIKRAHLEEDAAKSLHAIGSKELDYTLIDFNRCGMPLLEIVSQPDMNSPQEAYDYLVELKKILKWVNASDCDMEKGQLRCDVNVSIRPKGETILGQKVEIKNLNSFKAAKDAIAYEMERQKELFLRNEKISQDTRLWNEKEQKTFSMRSKEMSHDYRYFPEPDLPPLYISENDIKEARRHTGKLPGELRAEYEKLGLSLKEALALSENRYINAYFEKILSLNPEQKNLKNAVNLIMGPFFAKINELKIGEDEILSKCISPENLLEIAFLISRGEISSPLARQLIELCWDNKMNPSQAVEKYALRQSSDSGEIETWVKEAVEINKKAFEDFKNGNEKASGPIVGFVMKKSRGKANPQIVNEVLKRLCGN